MYQVTSQMERASAERIAEILSSLDPSPAEAVSTEEASRSLWSLDVFCVDEEDAHGAADIIHLEAPSARIAVKKLEDRDWVTESLKGLPAVHAGRFVVAGAHELARVGPGRTAVWIEAGPAFGTGHHGTTKGCLLTLADIARTRPLGNVLDLGSGSGVLALAALKAGAKSAVATDIDPESVRVASENARNNKAGPRLRLLTATGTNHCQIRSGGPYDLVMANILARPLVQLAHEIAQITKPGGRILLSGLLTRQEPQVRGAYAARGLVLKSRKRINGWSTLLYERPKPSAAAQATRPSLRRSHVSNPLAAPIGV